LIAGSSWVGGAAGAAAGILAPAPAQLSARIPLCGGNVPFSVAVKLASHSGQLCHLARGGRGPRRVASSRVMRSTIRAPASRPRELMTPPPGDS
jgi:hypothetical protein